MSSRSPHNTDCNEMYVNEFGAAQMLSSKTLSPEITASESVLRVPIGYVLALLLADIGSDL